MTAAPSVPLMRPDRANKLRVSIVRKYPKMPSACMNSGFAGSVFSKFASIVLVAAPMPAGRVPGVESTRGLRLPADLGEVIAITNDDGAIA